MTLNWLDQRAQERSKVCEIEEKLRRMQEDFWCFQLKREVLSYLSSGEENIFEKKRIELTSGSSWNTRAEYRAQLAKLIPNGRMDLQELEQVCVEIKHNENGGIFDFLGDVVEHLLVTEWRPEANNTVQRGGKAEWTYGWVIDSIYRKSLEPEFIHRYQQTQSVVQGDSVPES